MPTNDDLSKKLEADHDTLIRVESKVDNLVLDLKSLTTSLDSRLLDHETRIRKMEELAISVNPVERIKQFDSLLEWQRGWNVRFGMLAAIGGLIGAGLTLLAQYMGIAK